MTLTNCYTTLDDVNVRLGGSISGDHIELAEAAITEACRAIDVWCGQVFYDSGSATARTFSVRDACRLDTPPFSTTTGLVVKTDDDDDGTYETTWTSTDYEAIVYDESYTLASSAPYVALRAVGSRSFPTTTSRLRVVQVTARWGWSAVPSNVAAASKILAVDLFKRKDVSHGVTANVSEFGPVRVGRDAFAQVSFLLAPLRRVEHAWGIA